MEKLFHTTILVLSILLLISCVSLQKKKKIEANIQLNSSQISEKIKPPIVKKIPDTLRIYGKVIVDNYSWLKDKTRSKQEVVEYIEAENEYTEKMLASTQELQQKLYKEMIARIEETDLSVPVKCDSFYYYWKKTEGKQYSIYCRKKHSLDNPEQVILNPNKIARNHSFCNVSYIDASPEQNLLAYCVDTTGSEKYTLFIKNLTTKNILKDQAYPVGDVCWGNENIIFYITEDISGRTNKVYRHTLGNPSKEDELVFQENDSAYYLWIYRSRDENYIILSSGSKTTSEIRYLNTENPAGDFVIVQPRKYGVEYYICPHLEDFYIVTNADGAKNNKVMLASFQHPAPSHWKEFIPPITNCKINIDVFKNFIAVYEMEGGIERIKIIDLKQDKRFYLDFPDSIYTFYTWGNRNFDTKKLRLTYESLTTPPMVVDYDMDLRKIEILKRKKVGEGFQPTDYHAERIYTVAKDGTRIPITLVYKKDLFFKDGTNPLLLSAYGSYGDISDPYFSTTRLSILDRGFVYAIAHVRGGGEYGEDWYEQGKLLNKKNTFTDYIACAEHLLKTNYTSREKLVGEGSSAGGLLIGAIANMRPELFRILVADVPFVDVINTMLDTTLSAVVSEYDEWGNPSKKDFFEYMLSYSPYDNVEKQDYPNMLILAGFYDPRVNFWEPAKWTAKLRANKTDANLLLLKTNMSGHSGASGRYDYYEEIAFEYAFILDVLGIE